MVGNTGGTLNKDISITEDSTMKIVAEGQSVYRKTTKVATLLRQLKYSAIAGAIFSIPIVVYESLAYPETALCWFVATASMFLTTRIWPQVESDSRNIFPPFL